MPELRTKQSVHDNLIKMSAAAFAEHVIREESDGRWLLQKRMAANENGGDRPWDSAYWAEVVAMRNGILVVNGDIDLVAFAHYSGNSPRGIGIVSWMGMHKDWRYIVEKAAIGMSDDRKLVTRWESEVAQSDIREDLAYEHEQDEPNEKMIELLSEAAAYGEFESQQGMYDALRDIMRDIDYDTDMEFAYGYGVTIAARVFYAHAALHRLAVLLSARESST